LNMPAFWARHRDRVLLRRRHDDLHAGNRYLPAGCRYRSTPAGTPALPVRSVKWKL
jgi:hypothetical protein